jgi:hypothetical protein
VVHSQNTKKWRLKTVFFSPQGHKVHRVLHCGFSLYPCGFVVNSSKIKMDYSCSEFFTTKIYREVNLKLGSITNMVELINEQQFLICHPER